MKIRVIDRLRHAARRFRSMAPPCGVILAYHSIADRGADPHSLCVSAAHFQQHLEALATDKISVLPLDVFVERLRARKRLRNAVVITFDDGYADNLHQAQPSLQRHGMPATLFVVTGYLGQSELWWDELERIVFCCPEPPATLSIEIGGKEIHWQAAGDADRARYRLHQALYAPLRSLAEGARRSCLDQLQRWSGAPPRPAGTRTVMNADDLRLWAGAGLDVGAHSVSHPVMAQLPPEDQLQELQGSKTVVGDLLGRPVTSFAYPYGSYSLETCSLAKQAGFGWACSLGNDAVWSNSDIFHLPRMLVGDWDGETFARLLRWVMSG